jgi:prevent-host-death family protein
MSVADAKRHLSECLARVAFGGETILITRRGRPMARLVPVNAEGDAGRPAGIRGWLDDDDPFFDIVDDIVAQRVAKRPRVMSASGLDQGGTRRPRARA